MKPIPLILIAALLSACQSDRPLLVAVAASLGAPMEEIAAAFETKTQIHTDLSIAASGVHAAQITQGAPFNLFLSADMKYPQMLADKGMTMGPPVVFAYGELVFWSKDSIPADKLAAFFTGNRSGKIAIANPDQAPFGRAALDWLTANGWDEPAEERLVYGENISHVNRYIFSGVVVAAFTARSAMFDPSLKGSGFWLPIGGARETKIPHGLVRTKHRHRDLNAFIRFLESDEAKFIWEKYGYAAPDSLR